MMGGVFSRQQEVATRTTLLTVAQLNEQLQNLVDWQPFAIFLEGITQPDIETIVTNNPLNVVNQRNALYDLWLRRCPNPSWDHVITALDKAREHTLAQRIREHVIKYEQSFEHNQPQPHDARLSQVTVDEDTVKQLTQLRNGFHELLSNFHNELSNRLQKSALTLNQLISRLRIEKATYDFHHIDDIKDINEFFNVIQPHSTFLSYHLLVLLAEKFLDPNSEVLECLHSHHQNITILKHNVKIQNLKNVLQLFITTKSVNETTIIVKAQKAWEKNELHAVEDLLKTLFPFEHQRRLFRVEPGSVCIVYLVPQHITESLITHSQHKKKFMALTGIISLQVGETANVLQASEENEQFTFEMGLMEAVEISNNEAVKFLLEHTHTNINIQTQDNGGLGTITDTEKPETEQIPETTENQLIATDLQTAVAIEQLIQSQPSISSIQTGMETSENQLIKSADIQEVISYVATGRSKERQSKKELDPVDQFKLDSNQNIGFIRDPVGTTPLMIACINDDTDMIQLLLEHKANTNIQTRTGWTALMYAASLGNTRTVELLLKHNAEVNTIKNSNGATALMYSIRHGNVNIVLALLKQGADPEWKTNYGETPLYIASQEGQSEVVERLLQAKANPDTAMDGGVTPLFIACQKGHSKVVEKLLQAKANPNTSMHDGTTPLFIASQEGHSKIVKRLLQAKANPDTPLTEDVGATPLYIASQKGNSEVVEKLLQAKANPNTSRDNGATPLHAACQNGHLEVVKMLLQAKADPYYLMNSGRSPLYFASLRGHSDIVEFLNKHYYTEHTTHASTPMDC